MEEDNAFKNRNKHFPAAITSLQKISEKNTPDEKLEVITTMYHDICSSSTAVTWSMDALLPVTMYVVVRARVPQLGAELAELEELMEPHLCQVRISEQHYKLGWTYRLHCIFHQVAMFISVLLLSSSPNCSFSQLKVWSIVRIFTQQEYQSFGQ